MKRIISIVLAVLLVFAVSGCKKERSETSYDGVKVQDGCYFDKDGIMHVDTAKLDYTAGSSIKWNYDDETNTLSFEGEGELSDIKNFAPYKTFAEKIVIGEGITSVVNSAFDGFSGVSELTIAPSVESIGAKAFRGLMIKEVNLPVRLSYLGKNAFADCGLLESVAIPKNDGLYEIKDGVFKNCDQLKMAIIPQTITYISPTAFENCTNLAIYASEDSFAHDYALTEGIFFQNYSF